MNMIYFSQQVEVCSAGCSVASSTLYRRRFGDPWLCGDCFTKSTEKRRGVINYSFWLTSPAEYEEEWEEYWEADEFGSGFRVWSLLCVRGNMSIRSVRTVEELESFVGGCWELKQLIRERARRELGEALKGRG